MNHVWSAARIEALLIAGGRCVICAEWEDLEVHHEPPVGPRGYSRGCQHHQANLRVLCHDHHVEADAARRRAEHGEATQLSLLTAA